MKAFCSVARQFICLDDLDKEMESRGHTFAQYANDFVILVNRRKAGERVIDSLRRFIESKLQLNVNEEKSRVVPSGNSEFLGFTFSRKKIRWADKTLHTFKTRMRELTKRN